MAIEIDGTPHSGTGVGSPITVSHTTGAGSDRLMLVGISGQATNVAVSGVTYGGVALDPVGTYAYSTYLKIWIYKKVAPTTGTADVVVSFSTAPTGGGIVGVITFTGMDQSVPLGTFVGASAGTGSPTVDVSSASGELVIDTAADWQSMTVGADQTQRWNVVSNNIYGSGSTEPGAGTVTMSWTTVTSEWSIGAVPIKPVSGPSATISGTATQAMNEDHVARTGGRTIIVTLGGGAEWIA